MSRETPHPPHNSFIPECGEQPHRRLGFQVGTLARRALYDIIPYADISPDEAVERSIAYLAETQSFARINAFDGATDDIVGIRTRYPSSSDELVASTIRVGISPEAADALSDLLSRHPHETAPGLLSRGLNEYTRAHVYASIGYDIVAETTEGAQSNYRVR